MSIWSSLLSKVNYREVLYFHSYLPSLPPCFPSFHSSIYSFLLLFFSFRVNRLEGTSVNCNRTRTQNISWQQRPQAVQLRFLGTKFSLVASQTFRYSILISCCYSPCLSASAVKWEKVYDTSFLHSVWCLICCRFSHNYCKVLA